MLEMLKKMVNLQVALNDLTLPLWRERKTKPDYHLAMAQECAELIDHWGWKWWAKQPRNLNDAKMELVDIFHFMLSELIVEYGNDGAVRVMTSDYSERYTSPCHYGNREFWLKGMEPIAIFRLLGSLSYMGYTDSRVFWVAIEAADMDFEEFSKLYMTKVVLNRFRQERGYKQGIYVKRWGELEDNYYAMQYASDLEWQDPASADMLYAKLAARYKTVTKTPA